MDKLYIAETNQTPEIKFDFMKGEVSIVGKSYPENVNETYKDLLDAINEYCSAPQEKTIINFNWLYYNTATSKIIVKIIALLNKANTELEINWICKKDFTMMIEKAITIRELMNIKINIVEN